MPVMLDDFRHGIRTLRTSPGFAATAVVTLALGIGANSAIFSAVSALLVRALPVRDADRVVSGLALREGFDPFGTSILEYSEYRRASTLAASGLAGRSTLNLIGNGDPERVPSATVTAGYFEALDINPLLGRRLAADDNLPSAPPVAVLGYGLWMRRYAGDPNVIGKVLKTDDVLYTIVAVMPRGVDVPAAAEVWTSLQIPLETAPIDQRFAHGYDMLARLAPGATVRQADDELKRLAARLELEHPRQQRGWTYTVIPLRQALLADLRGHNRKALATIMAAVGFLLLICCANVGNLMIVRGIVRERDIAVRVALGASRSRIVSHLVAESLVIGVLGGAVGLLAAAWMVPLLHALNPIQLDAFGDLLGDFRIDGRVVLFTAVISIATGVIAGLVPAVSLLRRRDVIHALKRRSQRSGGHPGRTALGALVVAEVAVASMLCVAGVFVVESFDRLQRVELGFRSDNLMAFSLALPPAKYSAQRLRANFAARVIDRVRALPGVVDAGITTNTPLQAFSFDSVFTPEGRPPANSGDVPITAHRLVSARYLETLGVRLVKGRLLDERDVATSAPVVVITEELARQAWPYREPLGRRLHRGRPEDTQYPWMTVVGVIADVKEDVFNFRINRPAWYVPYEQGESAAPLNLLVRTSGEPTSMAAAVRDAIRTVDREQAVAPFRMISEEVHAVTMTERFSAALLGALAAVGLLLAGCGLYGVISYSVSQRIGELGLRVALGATGMHVMRLILVEGAVLIAIGMALGLAGARAMTATMAGMLYRVDVRDGRVFALVAVGMSALALAACAAPARRAASADPLIAMRAD